MQHAALVIQQQAMVQQQTLLEQLTIMQAERDQALRQSATLQQSLKAALADASACRRGLASTQHALMQKEAELRRLRGMSNRRGSGSLPESGASPMSQQRRSSFQRQRSGSMDMAATEAATKAIEAPAAPLLAERGSSGPGGGSGASRLLTRSLGLVELSTAWRLYEASPSAAAESAPEVEGESPAAVAAPAAAAPVSASGQAGAEVLPSGNSDLGNLLPLLQAVRWQLPAVMECKQCAMLLLSHPDAASAKREPGTFASSNRFFYTSDAAGGGKRVQLNCRGVAAEACRARTTLNLEHGSQHPQYDRKVDLTPAAGETTSMPEEASAVPDAYPLLCTPIIGSNGKQLGVLQAAGKTGGEPFDVDDELLLRLAAETLASAVQNSQVHGAVSGFSSSLMRLCRDLFSQSSPDAVLHQLSMWGKTLLGATEIRAALSTDLAEELQAVSNSSGSASGHHTPAGEGERAAAGGEEGAQAAEPSAADGGDPAADAFLLPAEALLSTQTPTATSLSQRAGGLSGLGRPSSAAQAAEARRRGALSRVLSGGGAVILEGEEGGATFGGDRSGGGGESGSLMLLPMTDASGRVHAVVQARRGESLSPFVGEDVRRFTPAMSLASLAFEKTAFHHQERLEMIDVTRFSSEGSALQEMIVKIRRRAVALAGARAAALYIIDYDNKELWALSNSGVQMCWPIKTGLIGRAARSGKAEHVTRARDHPDYNGEVDLKVTSGQSSVLIVPILALDRTVMGVLELTGTDRPQGEGSDGAGGMTPDDLPSVVAFASGVSASLENALQYEKLMEASQLQHELLKCMKTLTAAIDENVATNYVRAWLRKHVNVDKATVFFVGTSALDPIPRAPCLGLPPRELLLASSHGALANPQRRPNRCHHHRPAQQATLLQGG